MIASHKFSFSKQCRTEAHTPKIWMDILHDKCRRGWKSLFALQRVTRSTCVSSVWQQNIDLEIFSCFVLFAELPG
ncbi:hypothetical protein CEXT_528041 [Caerostris extrusa]|uniref:Uncharacterized protein n=1 Tax=Caerostris extrusa TaxID=172846 RepID=A0AAV4XKF2_CAEEX|nr:hypothetical protein CEXT_528041 [Caerostris extrusa]